MKWAPVEIARFARGAGFPHHAVTTATALALATSHGIATYDFRAGAPGSGHYKGLWAINVDRHPEYAGLDLHVPQINADAAYGLTVAHEGFGWSPAYLAGRHFAWLDRAGVSASDELRAQSLGSPVTFGAGQARMTEAHRRIQAVHDVCRAIDHERW